MNDSFVQNVNPLGPRREDLRRCIVHSIDDGRDGEAEPLGTESRCGQPFLESFMLFDANARLLVGFGLPPIYAVCFRNVDDIESG